MNDRNNDPLQRLVDRALPEQNWTANTGRLWNKISRRKTQPEHGRRRSWSGHRWVIAGISLAVVVSLFGLWKHRLPDGSRPDLGSEPQALVQIAAAAQTLERRFRRQAPESFARSAPALSSLEAAMADLRQRLEADPDDPQLARMLIDYATWRTELLVRLEGGNA